MIIEKALTEIYAKGGQLHISGTSTGSIFEGASCLGKWYINGIDYAQVGINDHSTSMSYARFSVPSLEWIYELVNKAPQDKCMSVACNKWMT